MSSYLHLITLLLLFFVIADLPESANLFFPVDMSISGCMPILCLLVFILFTFVFFLVKSFSLAKIKTSLLSYLSYVNSLSTCVQSAHAGVVHALFFTFRYTLAKFLFYSLYPYFLLLAVCFTNLFVFFTKTLSHNLRQFKPTLTKAAPPIEGEEDPSDKESSHAGTRGITRNQKSSFQPSLPVSSIFEGLSKERIAFIEFYFKNRLPSESPYVSPNPLTTVWDVRLKAFDNRSKQAIIKALQSPDVLSSSDPNVGLIHLIKSRYLKENTQLWTDLVKKAGEK